MSRQEALRVIWKRLIAVLCIVMLVCAFILVFGGSTRVATLVFLIGNIGGYVSVHRSLADLKDIEIVELAGSWLGIIVPSFIGGILGLVLYFLFMSNILAGDVFPKFMPDSGAPEGFESIFAQHAEDMKSYAKLFFWSFVAGFNQKYVVDIINSVKANP